MKKYLLCAAAVLMVLACACSGKGNLRPVQLRCEYQVDPVVVEAAAPRLSWIDETVRPDIQGESQTAWQVLVASSPALLKEGKADVWDSGRQASAESHLVPFGGAALEPMKTYYWKVRVWDAAGNPSAWSKTACWGTGPAKDGWEAQWIGAPWQEDTFGNWYTRYPMFRKEFNVGGGLKEAKAYISGLGYFEMSLNGQKVGDDFLAPGLTDYTLRPHLKENPRIPLDPEVTAYRTLYLGYDITSLLKKGDNAVGVILGNGYFHTAPSAGPRQCESFGVPRLICRIELTYKDGRKESICSDTSWKAAPSPFVFGDIWEGEAYDAREEIAGWNCVGLDDADWQNAVVRNAPDGPLTANMGPTDKILKTYEPISFEKQEDGSYKVDFGTVISGWVHFKGIRGKEGDVLKVNYISEYASPRCEYIFAGDAPVDFAPRFTWFVFREAVISGIENLTEAQVVAESVGTDVPVNAEFTSSNPLFEQILQIFRQSQIDNMHSCVSTDCPHRERLPYTGDGEVAMNAVISSFAADAFYNKWIGDVLGSQHPETGYVPNGAPWEPMCGGGVPWGASICVMPWDFYERYGDKQMLAQSLEGMKKYLGYLGSWARPDGTVHQQRPTPDGRPFYWYNLGDWAPAFQTPDDALVHTFYYWYCARNVAATATALGDTATAEEYASLRDRTWEAFHKVFYNAEEKSYGDFGSNAYALYMGVPEEYRADVRETLRNELMVKYKGHVNTGFVATRFLFEALSMNGMGDVAYTLMNQRDFPSYGWWIEQGATTSWEQWNGNDSRNHPMFGGGLTWFSRVLAGVDTDPAEPGFRHVIVRPMPVAALESVSYSTETPYGKVRSSVSHDGQKVTVEVQVPVGAHATVYVPKSVAETAAEPLDDARYEVHEVGSGTYRFTSGE